jgi:PAS domain S-box-containing protein
MFWRRKRKEENSKDLAIDVKIAESQRMLLQAATDTANAAQEVTMKLKARLDDSIKQFEETARMLSDGLIVCDLHGRIQFSNPAADQMFGCAMRGSNILIFFDRQGSLVNSLQLWKVMEDRKQWAHSKNPLRGKRQTGATFDIKPSITRLDWSDKTSSMLIVVSDVSELVAQKAEVKRFGKGFKAIFDKSFDSILIEQKGVIVAANPSTTALFGYDVEDILDKPLSFLFRSEDRVKSEPNEGHYTVTGIDENGNILNLVFRSTKIIWRDVPARLITVKGITPSNSPPTSDIDFLVTFNTRFKITSANQAFAELYGRSKSEVLSMDIRTLMDEGYEETLRNLTEDSPSYRSQDQIEKGVSHLIIDWIDHAVFNEDGEPCEYQRVGRDITDVISSLVSR